MATISPEFADLLLRREILSAVVTTIQGIMIWDLVINIGPEIRYIYWPKLVALFRHGRIPSPSACILFFSRLLILPKIATSKILVNGRTNHCLAIYRADIILYAIASSTGSAIFVIRTLALRNSRRPLFTILWTLWLIQLVIWIYWSTFSIMKQLPRLDSFTITCRATKEVPSWTWLLFLGFGLFDFLLLLLTLETQRSQFSLFLNMKRKENVFNGFFKDTWFYFALSCAVSIIEMGWIFQFRASPYNAGVLSSFHTWLCLIIAPRTIRKLLLKAAKARRLEQKLHCAQTAPTTGATGLCFSTSTTVSTDRKREQDTIAFDTSILSRIGPAEHYFPPAHSDSITKATPSTVKLPPRSFTVQEGQSESQTTLTDKRNDSPA